MILVSLCLLCNHPLGPTEYDYCAYCRERESKWKERLRREPMDPYREEKEWEAMG